MARILKPERIFNELAKGSGLSKRVSISAVTPHRTVVLSLPEKPDFNVRFELKESMLTRLMMCRLDFSASLDMELIRWADRDSGIETGSSGCIPVL